MDEKIPEISTNPGFPEENESPKIIKVVGVGGGLHFNKDLYRLSGGGTNSNIQLMAGYRLFRNSVVRLAEELTFDHFVEPCTYQLTSGDNAGQRRSGMGVRTYRYLFSALTYQYDLMGLFNENPSRRWEMSPFVGFAVSYYLNEKILIFDILFIFLVQLGKI